MVKNKLKAGGNKVANQITTQKFLNIYDSENEFVSFYENLNSTDHQGLESGFEAIENKLPLNNGHIVRFDPAGKPYVFAEVKYPQGSMGLKIPLFGSMQKFIKDYQMGKVNIAFTLEDLYSEAVSEEAESVES